MYEFVVLPAWPHMAKTNRTDGSFATADLFIPHLTIKDAWKYHSRADSQLTLITGKRFDPTPLESAIVASPLLNDVLIFGNGQPFPSALLFRSESSIRLTDDQLLQLIPPIVEKLNGQSQGQTRIPLNMLILVLHPVIGLEKSSKGTIMRAKAEEQYAKVIHDAYLRVESTDSGNVPDEDAGLQINQ